ncbi:hypothetical protein LTS08_004497 [Lithohypha guttulata]|nr:hypothetical protein LTS08_004497 [Lithohypha guttulata]
MSHVPAWKRLGLKLKYAKEEPNHDLSQHKQSNRAEPLVDGNVAERPSKRQRISQDGQHATERLNGHQESPAKTSGDSAPIAPVNGAQGKRPSRKSVSFADDTKAEDGDSRITIDFPENLPGSATTQSAKRKLGDTDSTFDTENLRPVSIATTPKKKKKNKDRVKSRGDSEARNSVPKGKKALALDYLSCHKTNRRDWKFNKNRDVWVLSHALSTVDIPSSHTVALAGYVAGLPSNAAARQRLVEQCRNSMKEETEVMDDTSDRMALLNLVEEPNSNDVNQDGLFERYPRAQILLWALKEDTNVTRKEAAPTFATSTVPLPRVRKNKTRTAVASVSSSESDSESDSSDNSQHSSSRNKVHRVVPNRKAAVEETSSSGSSSTDGDDDTSSNADSSSSNDSE